MVAFNLYYEEVDFKPDLNLQGSSWNSIDKCLDFIIRRSRNGLKVVIWVGTIHFYGTYY